MGSEQTVRAAGLDLPGWVTGQFRALLPRTTHLELGEGLRATALDSGSLALYSCELHNASCLDASALQHAVGRIYSTIGGLCESGRARFPLRYWNFIPAIHETMGHALDRYMVFNMGRHDSISRQSNSQGGIAGRVPAATGIGHNSDTLVVHCLAASSPPVHIENPRQIPAYCYSAAYGPRPPCFARASLATIHARRVLMIGGTASVRGEASVHPNDTRAQVAETLENLRVLAISVRDIHAPGANGRHPFDNFIHARAYFANPDDEATVEQELRRVMPHAALEFRHANICRPELLIEIEALVDLPGDTHP
ncbi:chorismate lyase / 3-hydroxybenzoate synthase [Phycisphaerales bacterium]|nr:chorismate lyase / 3-hydroxybenzoate synthase [Phycisphaerales bacterium]